MHNKYAVTLPSDKPIANVSKVASNPFSKKRKVEEPVPQAESPFKQPEQSSVE
jgi:hypothetical protein